jgi:hypothetical protein
VCADPEPVVVAVSLASQGAVAPADLDCVHGTFFTEAQRRMPGISFEQREVLVRQLLNGRGQLVVALPEGLQGV